MPYGKQYSTELAVLIPVAQPWVTLEFAWRLRQLRVPPQTQFLFRRGPLPIDQGRTELVVRALREANPRYLLFVDSDILFGPDDALHLMEHHYPVCSGLYPDKGMRSCAWVGGESVDWDSIKETHSYLVDEVGLGFCLIDAMVFKRLDDAGLHPYFQYLYDPVSAPSGPSEDKDFCRKLKEVGIDKILIDGRVKLGHVFTGQMASPQTIEHLRL